MEKDEPSEASGRNVAEHGDWRAWVIEIRGSLGAVVGILALFQFPRWLKQRAFFSCTALEVRRTKSRCRQGWFLLESSEGEPVHASLPASGAAGNPCSAWLVEASPQSLPFIITWHSPWVFLFLSLLIRHWPYWIRALPNDHILI